ncbi:hypothetical protein D041_0456A, partial [Vibrio parahaemolyticus EKP-008]
MPHVVDADSTVTTVVLLTFTSAWLTL